MKMMNIFLNTVFYLLGMVLCIYAHKHMKWQDSFDYIVVGSGTAGSVVAARLSEDEDVSVLVLEAGGEITDPFIRIPRTWWTVQNPEIDWGYVTEPQAMSPSKIQMSLRQAKILGGCGSHNGVFYTRGSPHDFDKWAEMGNYNWSYDAVLPYFKKSEMMQDLKLANNGYHGTSGLLKTRSLEEDTIVEEFIKAGVEMGFEEIQDYHGPQIEGFSRIQIMTDEKGERSSSYNAFLEPVMCRRNLDIVTMAHVTKVSFNMDEGIPQADGVYFVKDGQTQFINARREVIVSSGAIGSPTLLMHSGIGLRQHLESLGITVISDLPVGDNLQDQAVVSFFYYLNETSPIKRTKTFTFEALFDQIFTGKGPWSGERLAFAFYKSQTQPSTDLFPYIEHTFNVPYLFLSAIFPELVDNVRKGNKITKELVNRLMEFENGKITLAANCFVLHPRTRGTIRLNSSDPMKKPLIKLDYFSNYMDVKDMIEAIRNVQKFIRTKVMQYAQAIPFTDHHPNCKNHVFDSNTYWECYIYNNFGNAIHYSSSCKMANDETGVVDDQLRVKGVLGLRVADTSIMPLITSGHTAAPAMMIAEKVADMIKMDKKGGPVLPSSGYLLTNMIGLVYVLVLAAYILTCQL